MTIKNRITSVGESAALLLSEEVLRTAGIHVGDEIMITAAHGSVILRPMEEVERKEQLNAALTDLLHRRKDAYERLA